LQFLYVRLMGDKKMSYGETRVLRDKICRDMKTMDKNIHTSITTQHHTMYTFHLLHRYCTRVQPEEQQKDRSGIV
jgi:hypothetical protein